MIVSPRVARPLVPLLALLLLAAGATRAEEAPQSSPTVASTPAKAAAQSDKARIEKAAKRAPAGMVAVPAGSYVTGCGSADTNCLPDEGTAQSAEVGAFMIDVDEVTVAQYRRCVDAKKCSADGLEMPFYGGKDQPEFAAFCNWGKKDRDRHPINCVSWSQADAFCKWSGKRLPTDAEWERAARGTDDRTYPWGNKAFLDAGKVANVGDEEARKKYPDWPVSFYNDGFVGTAPVGSYEAGKAPSGARDMIGNVWEWLADERAPGRAVRGGSWNFDLRLARISLRGQADVTTRAADGGFRCAK